MPRAQLTELATRDKPDKFEAIVRANVKVLLDGEVNGPKVTPVVAPAAVHACGGCRLSLRKRCCSQQCGVERLPLLLQLVAKRVCGTRRSLRWLRPIDVCNACAMRYGECTDVL